MNYDDRISLLKDWFRSDIASRFNMPRDLDPKFVALDVIEGVNRNIPGNLDRSGMNNFVALITKEITHSARTRTLPTPKEFIEACRNAAQSDRERHTEPSQASMDPYLVNANRIRRMEAVSDLCFSEPYKKKLISEYGLTEKDFEPYGK